MLKTSTESAEKIKREAGCAYEPLVEDAEPVIVPGVGGRPPIQASRSQVCQVIQPRMTEIFRMVRERLDKQRLLDRIAGGLVLTGGGANLPGVVELGQDMFNLGGRIGQPGRYGGLADRYQNPEYATAVGLVLFTHRQGRTGNAVARERGGNAISGLRRWMKHFF
jgi:cell division protein FtsA